MYADVSQEVPGTWAITVDDLTQKVSWSGPVAYYAQETSAEWVEEAPTNASNDTIEQLADYGAVRFSDMTVSGPGTASATAQPVYLVDAGSGEVVSYPSEYDASTDSFLVRYGQPPGGVTSFPAVPVDGAPMSTTTTTLPSAAPAAPRSPSPATTTTAAAGAEPHGYWLAASDGGVFTFGGAHFYGSAAGPAAARPVTGIAATVDDKGYWLVSASGGVFAFGDAAFDGSLPSLGITPSRGRAGRHLRAGVVGISASPGGGYWLVSAKGDVFAFGAHISPVLAPPSPAVVLPWWPSCPTPRAGAIGCCFLTPRCWLSGTPSRWRTKTA